MIQSVFGFSLTLMDSFWRETSLYLIWFNEKLNYVLGYYVFFFFFPLFKLLIMRGILVIPSGIIGSMLASVK